MDNRIFKKPYKPQFVSRKQYNHAKTLGAAPLPTFPASLLAPFYIDVQTRQNCTAYSGVKERFGVTGKRYDPEKQWDNEMAFLGVTDAPNGVEIDTKMQVGIKVGFVPTGEILPTDKALAYFWVTKVSGCDWFDSVRLAILQLYQKYGKVIPITIGVNWYSEWDKTAYGILTDNPKNLLGGHDIEIAGMEDYATASSSDHYLDLAGTWGTDYGDQGIFRVNRAIFNKYFSHFGAAYWSDDSTTVPAKQNLLVALLQNLVTLYKRLISGSTGYPPPAPVKPSPAPIPAQPAPIEPSKPALLWDTPANSKVSVATVCDELGLGSDTQYHVADTKRILLACIELESAFMNYRPNGSPMEHKNFGINGVLSSTDWGLCQINDYWHIGAGKDFPTVQYVLANPEECVRWMARLFKAGKADLWSSFKGQGYKKFL